MPKKSKQRTRQLSIAVTPEQKKLWQTAAKADKRLLSEWVRWALDEAVDLASAKACRDTMPLYGKGV